MTRYAVRIGERPNVTHDLKTLGVAIGVLVVVLALCLVTAIWPEAI